MFKNELEVCGFPWVRVCFPNMEEQSQLDPFPQKVKVREKNGWTLQMGPGKRRYEEKRPGGMAQEEG